MITKPDKNVLSYTYKISNNIYLMITIINSKIFVDKSVDKTYSNSPSVGVYKDFRCVL